LRTPSPSPALTASVRKGSPVVTGDGLVGRVVELGERFSRILLVTDLNSRVPVVVESTRYRAILEGDNTDTMKLSFVIPSDDVRLGDRIVTSGSGGLFPAGLPIGEVTAIKDGTAIVTPFVRFDRLEYVRVLRYDFPGFEGAVR
jgi:rod shape-determining protein MreC